MVGGAQLTAGGVGFYFFSFQGAANGGTGQFQSISGGVAGTGKLKYDLKTGRGEGENENGKK